MWICPTCGSTNESDWETCIICGTTRQTARDAQRPRKNSVTVPVEELMEADPIPDRPPMDGGPTVLDGFAELPQEPAMGQEQGYVPPAAPVYAAPVYADPAVEPQRTASPFVQPPRSRGGGMSMGILIGVLLGLLVMAMVLVVLNSGKVPPELDEEPADEPVGDQEEPSSDPSESTGTSIIMISVTEESLNAYSMLKVTGASSTSDLIYEGERFSASKMADGDLGTSWQEGVDGLGEGQCVTLYLDGEQSVSLIRIAPGNQISREGFQHNSRPRMVRFVFSDGSSYEWEFEDKMGFVKLKLSTPVKTSYVQIVLLSAYDASYQDTGFSEVEFYH